MSLNVTTIYTRSQCFVHFELMLLIKDIKAFHVLEQTYLTFKLKSIILQHKNCSMEIGKIGFCETHISYKIL